MLALLATYGTFIACVLAMCGAKRLACAYYGGAFFVTIAADIGAKGGVAWGR